MTISLTNVFNGIINASYTFEDIWSKIKTVYTHVTEVSCVDLVDSVKTALSGVVPFMAYIIIALALLETFFGKKLIGIQKFVLSFVLGFLGGAAVVAPVISKLVEIPEWISGLVVGVVAAVLCKIVYWLVYVFAAGYSVYMILLSGAYLEFITASTKGNQVIALAGAVVAIVLALIFRNLIERAGTAALGAWGLVYGVKKLYDFTALVPGAEKIVGLVVFGVIALVGFIVQVKTRKRY